MLSRTLRAAAVLALLAAATAAHAQAAKYTIKEAKTEPPKELKPAVAKLLDDAAVQLLDGKGTLICEVWFRKGVPAKATPEQIKNGITLREIPETTVLGALRVHKTMIDYRKQKIKEGVYTLRLAYQPSDGDHMGTAPNNEFLLVSPAAEDKDPAPMKEAKELQELSTKATGTSHPGVFLLFPAKDPGESPKLLSMPGKHWVLTQRLNVATKNERAMLILGLALIGTSSAA